MWLNQKHILYKNKKNNCEKHRKINRLLICKIQSVKVITIPGTIRENKYLGGVHICTHFQEWCLMH